MKKKKRTKEPTLIITESSNGIRYTSYLDRDIIIQLREEHASAGYTWVLLPHCSGVELVDSWYVGDPIEEGAEVVYGDACSTVNMKFKMTMLGRNKISLACVRPWKVEDPPAATFEVTIEALSG